MNANDRPSPSGLPDDGAAPPAASLPSYAGDKARIRNRLKRLEGQVRGVQRMVDEDQYCINILTQLSAVIAGARAIGLLVLEDHIRGCVVNGDPDNREATLAELTEAIERFTRTVG
jgi:CsoR family transcriptional regulator, copper-sensing transcriptional repressor